MAKKNKKLLIASIIAIVIIVVGVLGLGLLLKGGDNKSPIDLTNDFFNKYKKCDSEVVDKIEYPFDDELSEKQLKKYKELIKSQYKALDYEIAEEHIGEESAIVKVQFNVLDYKSSYDKATSYLSLYGQAKSDTKKIDYKLKEMEKTKSKEKYSIEFNFHKLEGKWQMVDLTEADLQKLAGIF